MSPFKSTQSFSVGTFLRTFRNRDAVGPAALNSPVRSDRKPRIEATGGAVTTPGNGYRYHFLTANPHSFIITANEVSADVSYIVIGGGGSGGRYPGPGNSGGGGGAGGYLTGTFPNMAVGTYPVTIAAQTAATAGQAGGSTVFNSLTANGGGGGGVTYTSTGNPGASGGGASGASPGVAGAATNYPGPTAQGYPGGTAQPDNTGYSGGGGGAGGAGGNGTPSVSGSGGLGVVAFSGDTGIPPAYGTSGPSAGRWFAGGGAGGPYSNGAEEGGAGGGGAVNGGGNGSPDLDAVANTGSGGAGVSAPNVGQGASGIVILRYEF